jgi:hypothetical protein
VGDKERQNSAFIRNLVLLRGTEGQGETRGCGQIAVKDLGRYVHHLLVPIDAELGTHPRG